jgi:capsular polysaccharide biosynthesis protein
MKNKITNKALSRFAGLLSDIRFNQIAAKIVASCQSICWRETPLALKSHVAWNAHSSEDSIPFHEVREVALASTYSLKLPSIAFSEKISKSERVSIEMEFWRRQTVNDHSLKVVTGSHKRILSDAKNILIITASGHPVDGLCVAMNGISFVQKGFVWPKVKRLPNHTLMVSAAMAEDNYYHWCLEVLPRIGAVLACGMKWEDFDQLLIRNKALSFQTESLKALGCPMDKVVPEIGYVGFDCELVTTTTHPANYIPSQFAISYLTGPFAEAVKNSSISCRQSKVSAKIYISRIGSRRALANENEVIAWLSKNGFLIVNLASYSLSDQILLFENARVIVGSHGAGMANLVYCKPGTRVLEIFHLNHIETMYWGIATQGSLDYRAYFLQSHQEDLPIHYLLFITAWLEYAN